MPIDLSISRRTERVVMTQFSDLLLTPVDAMREYYRTSYARMNGYEYPTHFMEIPYWIPIMCSMLPADRFERELRVVDDMDAAISELNAADRRTTYFFSVLDANLPYVRRLADTGAQMILGGYTDPADFADLDNVTYLTAPEELLRVLPGARPRTTMDYSLFEGLGCIPRYSLSSGCSFKCAFCTVPAELTLVDSSELEAEARALGGLDFRLVFLDDKSFGDAKNWREIERVGGWLREVNPNFDGFIIQTPPSLARKPGFLEQCRELGVKYVEFGVETVNDQLLKTLRKPFRSRHLYEACDLARELGLYVIPNFIVGIPDDDYKASLAWLEENVDIVPVVNVNWLALHYGNVRGDLGLPTNGVHDRDQNSSRKSWLTPEDEAAGWDFIDRVYATTNNHWSGKLTYAVP